VNNDIFGYNVMKLIKNNESTTKNWVKKQATVWDKGTFLDNYITKDIKINCYAIDKFFVEVVYDV